MLRRSSKAKGKASERPLGDPNEIAARIVEIVANEREGKNPHAVLLGRLGGQKGGKARAEKLTPHQRAEIAKRAARARWGRRKKK